MAYKIVLLPEAKIEVAEAALFYGQVSPELSEDFLNKFYRELTNVAEEPLLYQVIRKGYRKVNLKRFPFKIVFRINEDTIVVVALAHHKRRPFYWKNR